MARSPRTASPPPAEYARWQLTLQIEKDLQGAIRLGMMQAQLIRQVQANLRQLIQRPRRAEKTMTRD